MRTGLVPALAAAVALTLPAAARAQIITPGFTFAVATDNGACGTGTHFHSNTGGAFGNPAGKAEVGNFSSECVRGLSEYDLTGLAASPTAFVTFDVFRAGGLFDGDNDFPFAGSINVVAYQGDNVEDESDYQAASAATVGSFSTSGLAVGNTLSFDIASIFNSALASGWTSLGIRLQRDGESSTASGAWTFDTFRLTSDDQSTSVTPEPSTYLLLASGLGAIGVVTRRRARQS
jgi:hypothetical protein